MRGHTSCVNGLAVTRDNKWIISCYGNVYFSRDFSIRKWNLLEKTQETVSQAHNDSITCVALTNDKKYLISGSFDKTIRVWNLLEKRQEFVLQGHTCT